MSFNPNSNVGKDGNTAPSFSNLIAGKDGDGKIQDVFVGSDGAILIRGAGFTGVADGTATVTTAGTRVQLSNVACKRVEIQAHQGNSGSVVIGGSTVVAASAGRRGLQLFNTQIYPFEVDNLNDLYIDSTENGDKITYVYYT